MLTSEEIARTVILLVFVKIFSTLFHGKKVTCTKLIFKRAVGKLVIWIKIH